MTAEAIGSDHDALSARMQLNRWIAALVAEVDADPRPLRTTVRKLEQLIRRHADLYMLAEAMFSETPPDAVDREVLSGPARIRGLAHLMALLNAVLGRAPTFDPDSLTGVIPIYSLLNWFLCTPSGARLFLDPRVNAQLKAVLDEWGLFLTSEESRGALTDAADGWFSERALSKMPDFDRTYVCEPSAAYRGFRSWDDFFTRRLRPGARPIDGHDDPSTIVMPCEAAPYRIATGVSAVDRFWIKGFPYSLDHMLAGSERAAAFAGGTVLQSLLDATNYHRWHSPVDGRVVDARVEQGVYFWIEPTASLEMSALVDSQGYMAQLATRAIVFLEADDPAIGLMCVVPIGMVECSTCELTARTGDRVAKGDEIGMFHFGGSTVCMVFRPGVHLSFDLHGETPGSEAANIPVNRRIARVGR